MSIGFDPRSWPMFVSGLSSFRVQRSSQPYVLGNLMNIFQAIRMIIKYLPTLRLLYDLYTVAIAPRRSRLYLLILNSIKSMTLWLCPVWSAYFSASVIEATWSVILCLILQKIVGNDLLTIFLGDCVLGLHLIIPQNILDINLVCLGLYLLIYLNRASR